MYRATCVSRRRAAVAVKVMDLEQISTSLEDIRQEVQTMRLAQHENVLGLHVAFVKVTRACSSLSLSRSLSLSLALSLALLGTKLRSPLPPRAPRSRSGASCTS